MIDIARATKFVDQCWGDEVIPALVEYIKIPNKSPSFDPDWAAHGYMDEAVALFERWARAKLPSLPGATLEVVRLPGRTPVIVIDVPGEGEDTVLLYGHLDKQPEMVGWTEGYGPWIPRLEGDKLYGRGGADDGYAMFGALSALMALREQGVPHAHCIVLIEACEESGSYDLPYYIDHLAQRIGSPSLVVCLDSGCGNYDQLWMTTSLRGIASGTLSVQVLDEGVHSGDASGVVPSSFRILRAASVAPRGRGDRGGPSGGALRTGSVRAGGPSPARCGGAGRHGLFQVSVDARHVGDERGSDRARAQPHLAAAIGGHRDRRPARPDERRQRAAALDRSQAKPAPAADLGSGDRQATAFAGCLEKDPPYGARIDYEPGPSAAGWNAPAMSPWLEQSLQHASEAAFGAPPAYMGEGGSIPFMAMLGEKFPQAQFVVTGVLGPHSNAHGPNEFLHIPTGKRISVVIAQVLADQHAQSRSRS